MFTVLHKSDRGVEMLYNANHIQFIPPSEKAGDTGGVHMLCGPGDAAPGVHVGGITEGEVFIMNEKGATVARYWLGIPMPPPNAPEGTPAKLSQQGA